MFQDGVEKNRFSASLTGLGARQRTQLAERVAHRIRLERPCQLDNIRRRCERPRRAGLAAEWLRQQTAELLVIVPAAERRGLQRGRRRPGAHRRGTAGQFAQDALPAGCSLSLAPQLLGEQPCVGRTEHRFSRLQALANRTPISLSFEIWHSQTSQSAPRTREPIIYQDVCVQIVSHIARDLRHKKERFRVLRPGEASGAKPPPPRGRGGRRGRGGH